MPTGTKAPIETNVEAVETKEEKKDYEALYHSLEASFKTECEKNKRLEAKYNYVLAKFTHITDYIEQQANGLVTNIKLALEKDAWGMEE